jgi:ribosome maturation factor RimP
MRRNKMNNKVLLEKLEKLIRPEVEKLNYEMYHLEITKEDNEKYLRVYIDKPEGNITFDDCESVSRAVSEMLDIEDPIEFSYYLEVSSPGIERELFNDNHLQKHIGFKVNLKLNSLFLGKRDVKGILVSFDEENYHIEEAQTVLSIPRKIVSTICLDGEL